MHRERRSSLAERGSSDTRAARLANEQRGVITRVQLLELGWSEPAIDRRIAGERLHVLWPGTYAFGHANLTKDAWLTAAVLACGDGARLTARAAGAARGLMAAWSVTDVVTPKRRGLALDGIRAHRLTLRPEDCDQARGIPVTSLARSALDLAAAEGYERVGELLDEALLARRYDHAEMLDLLTACAGSRGMATLRRAVEDLGEEGVVFRSRPERAARDMLRTAGLLEPRVNAWFPTRAGHGHELDLWWPGLWLNFEIDGPRHRIPRRRRLDRLRDADLQAFGVTVIRVPDTMVTAQPERFLLTVGRELERRITLAERG
jgi:hypothetical protein